MPRSDVVHFESRGQRLSAEVFAAGASALPALILGHGAGSDRSAPALGDLATRLAARGIAVALYNFPYRELGRRAPDRAPVLEQAAADAAVYLGAALGARSLVLGGKSMGGRIAAQVVARGELAAAAPVRGLLFLGFPLHAAGRDGTWERRGATLGRLTLPLLFLQGTRDRLCRLDLLEQALIGREARVHVIADGDHSLEVPKRSGRSPEQVREELAQVAAAWIDRLA